MALSALGTTGPTIAAGLGTIIDPLALEGWTAAGTIVGAQLAAGTITLPGTMIAAGAAVTGTGALSFAINGVTLGPLLAVSMGSVDPAAITAWISVSNAFLQWLQNFGGINPVAFVAVPTGGAVTGTGLIQCTSTGIGSALALAAGLIDPVSIASWQTVGSAWLAGISALGQALSLGFTSPNGGGPLVGVSALS